MESHFKILKKVSEQVWLPYFWNVFYQRTETKSKLENGLGEVETSWPFSVKFYNKFIKQAEHKVWNFVNTKTSFYCLLSRVKRFSLVTFGAFSQGNVTPNLFTKQTVFIWHAIRSPKPEFQITVVSKNTHFGKFPQIIPLQ